MLKLSVANEEVAWTNNNLTVQHEELTTKTKVAIKKIQEIATCIGRTKKTNRVVDLDYNIGYTYGSTAKRRTLGTEVRTEKKREGQINKATILDSKRGNESNKNWKTASN